MFEQAITMYYCKITGPEGFETSTYVDAYDKQSARSKAESIFMQEPCVADNFDAYTIKVTEM